MRRKGLPEHVAVLDVGTASTTVIVTEVMAPSQDDGAVTLRVIGAGVAPNEGLRKGNIVDIDRTVASIRRALTQAETMAVHNVQRVVAVLPGAQISCRNVRGSVPLHDGVVSDRDVEEVLHNAATVPVPAGWQVVHALPQHFTVDDSDGVLNPVGLSGVRLGVQVHLVLAAQAAVDNLRRCAEAARLRIDEVVVQPLASASAVLHPDERNIGVAVVDMGAGTTDVAVYRDDAPVHVVSLRVGGDHVTNDIAVGLRAPRAAAEQLKRERGCATAALVDPDELIEVPAVGGRPPRTEPRQLLCEFIQQRIQETFGFVRQAIEAPGRIELLAAGAVITGAAAQMPGTVEMAEAVLDMPVRIGRPLRVEGPEGLVDSPALAAAVGAAHFAVCRATRQATPAGTRRGGWWSRQWEHVTQWVTSLL